ncbi:MAG: hypothetical protein JWN70_4259 [Planctomycetaceae bacterium]|nr:hypothetical protein [Planctomycetaceae bacterium]
MNLYGWRQAAFIQLLGGNDPEVLKAASARLSETMSSEPGFSKAVMWLHTLIESGFPLRQDRQLPSVPADGGLLTVHMETEIHALVVHCIAKSIARDDHLDLATESSNWSHPAIGALYQDLVSCGFTRSKGCDAHFVSWISRLSNGSPLFGDDFRSEWSFYTVFSNQELVAMVPVLQAATDFKRPLPEGIPAELVQKMTTELSEGAKEFVAELINWFRQIEQAGQDAFILWW